jgi:hypothetical protein
MVIARELMIRRMIRVKDALLAEDGKISQLIIGVGCFLAP